MEDERFWPTASWISVNTSCNLDCPGCYAKSRQQDGCMDMSSETARRVIEISAEMRAQRVIFLGGEPSLYSGLVDAMAFAHAAGLKVTTVTNGVLFTDSRKLALEFASALKPGDAINFSLKNAYGALAGEAAEVRQSVLRCLSSFERMGAKCSVSVVVSRESLTSLCSTIVAIRKATLSPISVSFLGPALDSSGHFEGLMTPREACLAAEQALSEIEASKWGAGVSLHVNFPLCWLEGRFIERAAKVCTVFTGCQVLNRTGIVFDPAGNLLVCNHMLEPVGELDADFVDSGSLSEYIHSAGFNSLFDEFTKLPYRKCADCSRVVACGGGCPLWFYA